MVTVPTLAIAAHGAASGSVPSLAGIAVCALIGVVAGLCTGRRCGAIALLTVLSAAQFVSHLALSATMPAMATPSPSRMHHAGMDHGAMPMPTADHASPLHSISDHLVEMVHLGSGDGMAMLLTHLIAIPVCAALIAAAVAVFAVITSVLAALRREPAPAAQDVVALVSCRPVARWHRIDRAAGAGERGPPLLVA